MRKLLVLCASVGLAVAFTAACGSDKKTDDGTGLPTRTASDAGADSTAAPLDCTKRKGKVADNAACDTCAKAKCCDEITACDKSADCAALEQCLAPCADNDAVCILGCQAIHDKGASTLQDVGSCAQTKCKNECPATGFDAGGDAPF